jgi:hypothetical protein
MICEIHEYIFGDYNEMKPDAGEYLTIGFSPCSLPLKKRWEHNGLSADFIADYFRNFYVNRYDNNDNDIYRIKNMCSAVKYIANELLENAMKFQDVPCPYSARILLSLHTDEIVFSVTNGVSATRARSLIDYIEHLLCHDPHELYLHAMRHSNQHENQHYSGFGLLSMLCDYSAKLGWKISYSTERDTSSINVTTMVILTT